MIDSPISDRDARGAMDDERRERRFNRFGYAMFALAFLEFVAILMWMAYNG